MLSFCLTALSWFVAGPNPTPVTSLEQIIQNMKQIKAAATAASAANPSPATSKPPRAPLPFIPTDPTPGRPHTRPVADTHNAQSMSRQADTKAGDVSNSTGDALTTRDALPSNTQQALQQDTLLPGSKPASASPALATASAAAAAATADVAGMQHHPKVVSMKKAAAEELDCSERLEPTSGTSEKAAADSPVAVPTGPAGRAGAEQLTQDVGAGPSSPPVTVPTEGIKPEAGSGRTKKSSREAEKKSSRDSKRAEEDRKPSRAKRRRSRSRSPSNGPKR